MKNEVPEQSDVRRMNITLLIPATCIHLQRVFNYEHSFFVVFYS